MPDTYVSGGSSRPATRWQIDAQWHDMQPMLTRALVDGMAAVNALVDLAREQVRSDHAEPIRGAALDLCGSLHDALTSATAGIRSYADDNGIPPNTYTFDLSEVEALWRKLGGRS